jgi:tRNA pseudouridine38-40 synthase
VNPSEEIKHLGAASKEDLESLKSYSCTPDQLTHLRSILQSYIGTHNHHNFTVGRKFTEKSSIRYIKSFTASEPFVRGGLEWISCKVHGQSFMLHQIRKLMGESSFILDVLNVILISVENQGLALLMVRTKTPATLISETYNALRMNIPRAPALGLLLERTVYEAYNKRIITLPKTNEVREEVSFTPFEKEMEEFKEKWIYSNVVKEELEKGVFEEWRRGIDERPFEYAWFLNSLGKLDETRRPKYFEKEEATLPKEMLDE